MNKISQLGRLIHINYVLAKNGLDEIILATRWFAPLRFLTYVNPWYWTRNRYLERSVRLRMSLEELGPIFVKFGQMLSARPDFMPEEYVTELARLQDRVKPFPHAEKLLEKIYGQKLSALFQEFDPIPLASASIAQVHAAVLYDGREVVVKVLRPGIDKIIKRDIALLYTLAGLFERYWYMGRRMRASEIVAEFEHTLLDELDLLREASNASILRRNFQHSPLLYIPEIYWPHCRDSAIVMEQIYGIPIANRAALLEAGINLKKLAENGIELFFTQVFRDCFFHADMHPGNIFVSREHLDNPQYILVDCGIVGSLTPTDQRYLAENMLAFFKRDYHRVAELHLESGWIPPDTRVQDFESAISTVCEPIFEKPLKDISFGNLLLRLFQTGKRFHMEIQPQLLLLQKTLLNVEGLGRQLYPDLDLWSTARPFLEKWLQQQVGPKAFLRKIRANLPFWLEQLPNMPTQLLKIIDSKANPPKPYFSTVEVTPKRSGRAVWVFALIVGVVLGSGVTWYWMLLR
ncbi:MAG: ubiquinone biosynthesis regulatory protein kinase UbiB [Legionellales bacterium]|nr:ubiquinone biosynthesis regulatory protein kinase UbiB [Legionellales bacterium]